jgi:hypothetical protein
VPSLSEPGATEPHSGHNDLVTAADAQLPFRASTGLAYLGGFFAYGLGLSALYAMAGVGLPCPFRWVTGWECPLCGATRMGSSLLLLDPAAAWAFNPVVLVGLVLLVLLGVTWTVEVLGGPRLRPPRWIGTRLRDTSPLRWLVIGLSGAVTYTLLRNLL